MKYNKDIYSIRRLLNDAKNGIYDLKVRDAFL